MTIGKIPKESQNTIDYLCQKYNQEPKKVEKVYWEIYMTSALDKKFDKSPAGMASRHVWAARYVRSEFSSRPPTEEKEVIFYGRGPINQFESSPPNCRLWVLDVRQKAKATTSIGWDQIKDGTLDQILLFNRYKAIQLAPQGKDWLTLDERSLPLPDPLPLEVSTRESLLTKIAKQIRMADIGNDGSLSRKLTTGKGIVYSDLRVIKGVIIGKSSVREHEWKGYKYKKGTMLFSDQTTEGHVLEGGTEIPENILTYVDGSMVYPSGSEGNIYGALRLKQNNALSFEFAYFEPTLDLSESM